jgi:hypothetical protein
LAQRTSALISEPQSTSRTRRLLGWVLLALGACTFFYLLWTFGPARVWLQLERFGWGFAFVLPFPIFDHLFNAWGWRLAFSSEDARAVPFAWLVRVRVAGDSLNYLTPSANVAGEFVRPAMLGGRVSLDAKVTSVVVAKAAQAVGQGGFILCGMAYLIAGRCYAFHSGQAVWGSAVVAIVLFLVIFGVSAFAAVPPAWLERRAPGFVERSQPVRLLLRGYLKRHPVRLLASMLCFVLGYLWGAIEIWLIAYLLGFGLAPREAFSIEVLSNLVDTLAFLVPAKIGTQELGKAAIFKGLGLSAELGFTVGLIRHIRELCWAGAGLALYAAFLRRKPVNAR